MMVVTKHLILKMYVGCGKEITKSYLKSHIKNVHEKINQFKCTFDGCKHVNSFIGNLNIHIKRVHLKKK